MIITWPPLNNNKKENSPFIPKSIYDLENINEFYSQKEMEINAMKIQNENTTKNLIKQVFFLIYILNKIIIFNSSI